VEMLQQYLYWSLLTKYKMCVAYDGYAFCGSQIQIGHSTVEGEILNAMKKVLKDVNKLNTSGRTDTGVHSEGQIILFETAKIFDKNRFLYSLNQILPSSICIKSLVEVEISFDARFSAKSRSYRYLFMAGTVPIYLQDRVVQVSFRPNDSLLNDFSNIFCGTHDFKCFRSLGSYEISTVRSLYEFSLLKRSYTGLYGELDDCFIYEANIVANSFLYRMVRHIMGAVFTVLQGKKSLDDLKKYFHAENTEFLYTVAPAKGLTLLKVSY
jgi:tRNA pseudouridine38-40 synthase